MLILEDDAYWFLQFPNGPSAVPGAVGLPAGFLSLDTDGRVIRIDTFSKALGPGYRVGWVTAAPPIAAKLCMAVSAASVGASSLPQARDCTSCCVTYSSNLLDQNLLYL